mmetsp:Transcript_3923/g.9525  ORF Transcript_3923/g.9525 Transcript_3923/m.9525 type:complete len:469 (-) Transcript_3923:3883-5289(-)|eukprot:CAMPEP_0113479074 /NCGR_PEP_ID=MMETSP0014_2-20120614/21111_1 /TAXON_ID=2857 /ORGANISM="Nitzschia sp." /LENGTH=468 /DNA_ID=CAMNT_0000372339 /DNA_START=572 /DNA_END=1978 /DNA_ORIENTATION=- /assembly_acc=CAM_ASM_000159
MSSPPTSPRTRRGRRNNEYCFNHDDEDDETSDVDMTETETGTVISFLGQQHKLSSSSPSSSTTSCLSTTSLLVLVVAISLMAFMFTSGIMIGYYGFYKHFNTRMMSQLHNTNQDHNVTLEILASRLEEALEERDSIQEESESLSSQVNELRGRLESQSNLASAHRDLVVKHQSFSEQYQLYQKDANQKMEQLQLQLTSVETELSDHHEQCASQINTVQQTASKYTDYIQRRENTLCRQWFDHDGPYHVEFEVGNGKPEHTMSFVVEISKKARRLLPHTVYTFLTLVESMTYSKSQMSFVGFSNDQKVLEISSNGSVGGGDNDGNEMASYLTRLGYYPPEFSTAEGSDTSVLKFLEKPGRYSEQDGMVYDEDFLCDQYSFGFIQHGPSLKLFLGDDAEWGNDGSQSICFGKVVVQQPQQGQEHDSTAVTALQQIKDYVVDQRTQLRIHSISYIPPDKYKITPPTMDEEE